MLPFAHFVVSLKPQPSRTSNLARFLRNTPWVLLCLAAVAGAQPAAHYSPSTVNVGGGFNAHNGTAVNGSGNLSITETGNNAVNVSPPGSVQLPTQAVGSTSSVTTLTFTFDSGGTIGAPAVLTMGASGLDFADAETGTCTTNGSGHLYSPGDNCTVDVTFTPKYPGMRKGAVELVDTSTAKNVVTTMFVYGTGTGPQAVFGPPTQTVLSSGVSGGLGGVAVDGNGDVYFADPNNNAVKMIPAGCAASTCVVTAGGGFNAAQGIAVDGGGNVYVADYGNFEVKEIPVGCKSSSCVIALGGTFPSVNSGTNEPVSVNGVAVDGSGNVYVTGNAYVWEMPAGCTSTACVTTLGGDYTFAGAEGVAVDINGNVYVANDTADEDRYYPNTAYGLTEMPAGCTSRACVNQRVISGSTTGVAVDGGGNIYVAAFIDGLQEVPAGCGSYTCVMTVSKLGGFGVAVDGGGNAYWTDASDPSSGMFYPLIELNRAMPPTLTFPTPTVAGTTDSTDGPQAVTVQNIGNNVLTFPLPTTGTNPSVSANFTWDEASTCTQTDAGSSSAFTLAAGATCSITIDFAPSAAGSINGSAILTDDILYTPGNATQTIPLSGKGIKGTPTISAWPTASSITYGQTLASSTLTGGTASVPGTFAWTTPSTAPSVGLQSESATFTPADTTDYNTATTSLTLAVNQATPVITWAAPAAIPYGTALSATQLNATAGVAGAFAYSPAAGTVLGGGSQTLNTKFTPTDSTDYATATDSVTLTVTPIAPAVALTSSANPSTIAQSVTFTAAVTSPAGMPTGSVTFWDGTTQLGSGTVTAGVATYATSSLGAGSHSITAQYSGDSNFTPVTSIALTQTVSSLSIGPAPGAPTTANITPGGVANFVLSVTPPASSAVSLSVSGLPTGATSTFSPNPVAAGAGPTNVQFVINLPGQASSASPQRTPFTRTPLALGLLLLPFLGLRRSRRRAGRFLLLAILAIAGAAVVTGLSGCNGHNFSNGPTQTQTPQGAYTLTVTATAGAATQTTTLTLNVQ